MDKLRIPDKETRDRLVENLRSSRIGLHKLDKLLEAIEAKFDEEAKYKRLSKQ